MASLCVLSTHVLNLALGIPAQRINLSLHRLDSSLTLWSLVTLGITDEDGRWAELTGSAGVTPGLYKLRFETGPYWETLGESCFYPYVEVVFRITEEDLKLHVPLLLSRFSYSTYRGS